MPRKNCMAGTTPVQAPCSDNRHVQVMNMKRMSPSRVLRTAAFCLSLAASCEGQVCTGKTRVYVLPALSSPAYGLACPGDAVTSIIGLCSRLLRVVGAARVP